MAGFRRNTCLRWNPYGICVEIYELTSDNLSSMYSIVYVYVVESILQELSSPPSVLIVYGLLILLTVSFTYYTDVPTSTTKSRLSRLQFVEGERRKAYASLFTL
jgi:hypothetical protein